MSKKILAIGRYNGFVSRSISELSKHSNLDAIILTKNDNVNLPPEVKNVKIISIINFIGIINFYYYIYKIRNTYDAVIFYYMQEYFFALLFLNIIKVPKYYFPFGSDLHQAGIKKLLLRSSLKKFNKIFVEIETQKQYIIDNYKIPKERIETSFIVFNVDSCFQLIGKEQKKDLRKKWNISKRYIIVSPRHVSEFYNHHKVIEGIGQLNDELRNNLELIIIGNEQNNYLRKILGLAIQLNVHILHVNKLVSAEEMAELQNIAQININIPVHDQFGHSIIEGCLCGSIPLLSDKIYNYHELMKENINCIYTNEAPQDIALKIENIILNYNNIVENYYINNSNKLSAYINPDGNSKRLINYITSSIDSN